MLASVWADLHVHYMHAGIVESCRSGVHESLMSGYMLGTQSMRLKFEYLALLVASALGNDTASLLSCMLGWQELQVGMAGC